MFETVGQRFDSVDRRLDGLDAKFDELLRELRGEVGTRKRAGAGIPPRRTSPGNLRC
jgi:hypothetical protein